MAIQHRLDRIAIQRASDSVAVVISKIDPMVAGFFVFALRSDKGLAYILR